MAWLNLIEFDAGIHNNNYFEVI